MFVQKTERDPMRFATRFVSAFFEFNKRTIDTAANDEFQLTSSQINLFVWVFSSSLLNEFEAIAMFSGLFLLLLLSPIVY